jgi:hypothetical protein
VAAVLPALFILGEFTYVRLVANTIENLLALQRSTASWVVRGWRCWAGGWDGLGPGWPWSSGSPGR